MRLFGYFLAAFFLAVPALMNLCGVAGGDFAARADSEMISLPTATQRQLKALLIQFLDGDKSAKDTLLAIRPASEAQLATIITTLADNIKGSSKSPPLATSQIATEERQYRISWVLEYASRAALRIYLKESRPAGPLLKETSRFRVAQAMQSLLRANPTPSVAQKKIIFIYDVLKLWSRDDLWFLTNRIDSVSSLQQGLGLLIPVLPEATDEERDQIEASIRKIPPHVVSFAALYFLNRANKNDVVVLFNLLSDKYAEAFQHFAVYAPRRKGPYELGPLGFHDFEDPRTMGFLNETVDHLKLALAFNKGGVTEAFAESVERASSIHDGDRKFRMYFLKQMMANASDIFGIGKMKRIAEFALQNGEYILPPVEPAKQTNLIQVNFRTGVTCETIHDFND